MEIVVAISKVGTQHEFSTKPLVLHISLHNIIIAKALCLIWLGHSQQRSIFNRKYYYCQGFSPRTSEQPNNTLVGRRPTTTKRNGAADMCVSRHTANSWNPVTLRPWLNQSCLTASISDSTLADILAFSLLDPNQSRVNPADL